MRLRLSGRGYPRTVLKEGSVGHGVLPASESLELLELPPSDDDDDEDEDSISQQPSLSTSS